MTTAFDRRNEWLNRRAGVRAMVYVPCPICSPPATKCVARIAGGGTWIRRRELDSCQCVLTPMQESAVVRMAKAEWFGESDGGLAGQEAPFIRPSRSEAIVPTTHDVGTAGEPTASGDQATAGSQAPDQLGFGASRGGGTAVLCMAAANSTYLGNTNQTPPHVSEVKQ